MFLTLNIDRERSCLYTARVVAGQVEVTDFQTSSVADAIWETVNGGFGAVAFHIWYEHVCAGTISMSNMRIDPEGIAQRLMSLHGSMKG